MDSSKNAISKFPSINAAYDGRNAQDDGEVDHELEQMMISMQVGGNKKNGQISSLNRKDNKQTLEWDEEMETMQREKNAAEAMRGIASCTFYTTRFCLSALFPLTLQISKPDCKEIRKLSRRCPSHPHIFMSRVRLRGNFDC